MIKVSTTFTVYHTIFVYFEDQSCRIQVGEEPMCYSLSKILNYNIWHFMLKKIITKGYDKVMI